MWGGLNPKSHHHASSTMETHLQFSNIPFSGFRCDGDMCEDEGISEIPGGRRSNTSSTHSRLGNRHDTPAASRSLFLPVSSITDDEEAVLVQPVVFPNEKGEENVLEVVQCHLGDECHPLQEDNKSSQCSVTSCKTQTIMTTTMMMRFGDPGAPKKGRAHCSRYCDVDELSVTCTRSNMCQNMDGMPGSSYLYNNNTNSIVCESSVPSHITPLEELGESVDLTNHISYLIVSASPTQKKLFFGNVVEDCDDSSKGNDEGGYVELDNVGQRMRYLQRGKRFLDELDANKDLTSVSSTPSKVVSESRWKSRRMDDGDGRNREGN